jgi:hypothetical protein
VALNSISQSISPTISVRIYSVKERYLQDFLDKIAPFRQLWRSVSFAGYAGKIGDTWVLLGGRMQLSPETVNSEVLRIKADSDTFFAFVDEFPIESFQQILQEIVESENIHMNMGRTGFFRDIRLRLEDDPNHPLSWFHPHKFDRTGGNFFDTEPVGFSWSIRSERQIATLPEAVLCLEKANEHLRRNTHIDGVDALARKLTPGLMLNSHAYPELQIVAPLPFGLADTYTGAVRLVIPATAQGWVSVKAFFYPESHPCAEWVVGVKDANPDLPLEVDWEPDWPETATHANIHLFWGRRDIDSVSINRWPTSASILGAVDEYFDSQHKRLRSALEYSSNKSSDPFELAVVRLLNILGIPAIWYGKTVEDRADAVAIIQSDTSTVLLLIECTREKPSAKFSTLAERANHLRRSLQIKAEVLPIVFTAARVVESEIRAAVEYGVGLIGADEIEHLIKLIATPNTTVVTVLQYLTPRHAVTDLILRTTGGLTGLG